MVPILTSLELHGSEVHYRWSDGSTDAVTALWLRHACHCPMCRTGVAGQSKVDIATVAPDQKVVSAALVEMADAPGSSPRCIELVFADGHQGIVAEERLALRRPAPPSIRWGAEYGAMLRIAATENAVDGGTALTWVAEAVVDHGLALLTEVPRRVGEVLRVAERLGYTRTTNYGSLFDVVVEPDPSNLANSADGLGVHTDNPYRDPVPTVQLLHCIEPGRGGASRFVDGFAAAERLAESDPEAFAVLSEVQVPFRYADDEVDLRSRARLIDTDDRGRVVAVRLNNRSMQPPDLPLGRLDEFYRAHRAFVTELERPDAVVELTLDGGDLVVFDNRRVLHGRSGFTPQVRRHLQGCYIDIDALASTARRSRATR